MAARMMKSALLCLLALAATVALLPVVRAASCGFEVGGSALHCGPAPQQMALVSGLGSCVRA